MSMEWLIDWFKYEASLAAIGFVVVAVLAVGSFLFAKATGRE